MTQQVTDASGQVHEFPDEATPEMIAGALGLAPSAPGAIPINPPPSASVSSLTPTSGLLRYAEGVPSNLLRGATMAAGIPGDLEALGTNLANSVTGQPPLDLSRPDATLFPTSQNLLDITGRLGLTDRAELQPEGSLEKTGAAALQGAGSVIPTLALGGGVGNALKGPLMPALGAGAAGGAAGEVANELMPGSKVAPIVAGLAAGTGAQGVTSVLASRNLGQIASTLGTSQTLQDAGKVVQQGARDWLTQMPNWQREAWSPVDATIPETTPMPLTNFESALEGLHPKAGNLQGLVDKLSPSLPAQLLQRLRQEGSGAVQYDMGTGVSLPMSTWGDTKTLRTTLGEALSNPQITKDIKTQDISTLYGALSDDMRGAAKDAGVEPEFNSANAQSQKLFDFAQNTLGGIVKGPQASGLDPDPEAVASRLLSGARKGSTTLDQLRQEIPGSVDELAAAHLLQTPQGWAKLAPEAKAALVPDPATRQQIESSVQSAVGNKPVNPLTHGIQSLMGEGAGHALSVLGAHLLGSPDNSLVPGAVGDLAGLAAPSIYRGVRGALANPALLRLPAIGSLAGSNQLWPSRVPAPTGQ